MIGRMALIFLSLITVAISVASSMAQTTIEVYPPATVEINPGPRVVYPSLPYGLDPSFGANAKLRHKNNVLMCRVYAVSPELKIGSPEYQAFMQQCVAEMERSY